MSPSNAEFVYSLKNALQKVRESELSAFVFLGGSSGVGKLRLHLCLRLWAN